MLCSKCRIEMRKIKTDYEYKESGLQDVFLKGISAYECPKCEEINPIISKIREVHKVIAQKLLKKDSLLTGRELVYLRKEMKIKAKDLAQILGVTKITVSRWENGKERLSPVCDRLIRFLYENRMFKETCELGIERAESLKMKYILAKLCEPKTSIEEVFRNIKRRQVHSKISIPISKFDLFAHTLSSYIGVEFKGVSFKSEQVSSNSGIVTDFRFEDTCRSALSPYLEVVTTVGLQNIEIGTTVDDVLTPSLTPPTVPNKDGWASA